MTQDAGYVFSVFSAVSRSTLFRNVRSRSGALRSVCSSTGTSQYCAFGKHSSRYRAADVACEASRPGTISAATDSWNRWLGARRRVAIEQRPRGGGDALQILVEVLTLVRCRELRIVAQH